MNVLIWRKRNFWSEHFRDANDCWYWQSTGFLLSYLGQLISSTMQEAFQNQQSESVAQLGRIICARSKKQRKNDNISAGVAQWQRNWFVISGLQVQLLSPAPRKILRYTVKTAACIVGFLLYHSADNARNVGEMWDNLQKMGFCGTGRTRILYAPAYMGLLNNGPLYAPASGVSQITIPI